jgi:hypothetical protein
VERGGDYRFLASIWTTNNLSGIVISVKIFRFQKPVIYSSFQRLDNKKSRAIVILLFEIRGMVKKLN